MTSSYNIYELLGDIRFFLDGIVSSYCKCKKEDIEADNIKNIALSLIKEIDRHNNNTKVLLNLSEQNIWK